ncbi:MraY family glycosyltransferase [Dietzia timorensis]|uniref:Decaprenyl-phosphate N-acetylglucosaminephosphotransferase n=1 Tax=Dietzia timorensis TaxID=499555 RepID=A0A173LKA8_9ACTN|nr:MraY family glycosyltransferase [Dietzia timorensis]ANI92756.1 Decaprenyl-phosphate N-acetylglucosaminephosphotransferase [Dietzia timorensis]
MPLDTTVLAQSGGFVGGAGVPYRELVLIAVVAGLVSFLVTGLVKGIAPMVGGVKYPRGRDVHVIPTPQIGGLGIFTGFCVAVFLASNLPALNRAFPPFTSDVQVVVAAGAVIVLLGFVDDTLELGAVTKLVGQMASAGVLIVGGVTWFLVYLPWGGNILVLDQLQAGVATALFTLVVVNAINFVDGLDGLAGGIGAIVAMALCLFAVAILFQQGGAVSAYPPALITAVLAGACIGFLPHNFHPARIFMGDTGAMFIGLILAAASINVSGRISQSMYGSQNLLVLLSPVIVVGAALFVPLLDLVLAVVRRVRAGQHPFSADRKHLHHRLLELGHSQTLVAIVIYAWVALFAFGAVSLSVFEAKYVLPVVGILFLVVLIFTATPLWLRSSLNRPPTSSDATLE